MTLPTCLKLNVNKKHAMQNTILTTKLQNVIFHPANSKKKKNQWQQKHSTLMFLSTPWLSDASSNNLFLWRSNRLTYLKSLKNPCQINRLLCSILRHPQTFKCLFLMPLHNVATKHAGYSKAKQSSIDQTKQKKNQQYEKYAWQ